MVLLRNAWRTSVQCDWRGPDSAAGGEKLCRLSKFAFLLHGGAGKNNSCHVTWEPKIWSFAAQHRPSTENRWRTLASWGTYLDFDGYVKREETLASVPFAAPGTRDAWVLVPADDPDTVDIRSSCETYNRKGSIVGVDGQIRDGTVFSIASVYTPEKHRRNGFAAEMLKQVRKVLLDEIPDLLASALYSDIGPTYYARLGWIPSPAMWNTEFDANNTVVVSAEVPAFQLQPIVENGELLRKVLLADRANWREKLASAGTPSLVVFQTPDSVHWHNVRGRLYQSINKRAPSGVDLSIVGVCVNDEESKPAFVLWAHNYKDDSLDVLRLAVDDTKKGVLARFVAASCEEARRTGLAKVTVWGKLDLLGAVEVGAKTYVRDESLSSLCVAPNASKKRDSVVWLGDEKGLWV